MVGGTNQCNLKAALADPNRLTSSELPQVSRDIEGAIERCL